MTVDPTTLVTTVPDDTPVPLTVCPIATVPDSVLAIVINWLTPLVDPKAVVYSNEYVAVYLPELARSCPTYKLFDVVLYSGVFESGPDAIKALDELSRLLKSVGELIINAPFFSLVHFT